MKFDPRVLRDVEDAAEFLCDRIEKDGWKQWSWNYLREHARCKAGAQFTNTQSPEVYKALRERRPDLARRIERIEHTQAGQNDMFEPT
jgi:hypothetical protein